MRESSEPGNQAESPSTSESRRGRCLAEGCPCRDARILLRRRATFFADLAARRGETANRVIAPEPGWILPGDRA
jgi:hypothetical protein